MIYKVRFEFIEENTNLLSNVGENSEERKKERILHWKHQKNPKEGYSTYKVEHFDIYINMTL